MTTPDTPHGMNAPEPDERDSAEHTTARSDAPAQFAAGQEATAKFAAGQEATAEFAASAGGAPVAGDGAAADDDHTELLGDLSADELALRRLMHSAVRDLAPAPDTLGHLRRAVPARRAHRRQVMVGSAAACLLALVAVPAVLTATGTIGTQNTSSANASSAHGTDGTGGNDGPDGNENGNGPVGGVSPGGKNAGGKKNGAGVSPGASPTQGASSSADPSGTLAANAPSCTTADLGNATGTSGSADADGKITGYFRVANVSTAACTVDGAGAVSAEAEGSADASRISVVDHTPDDASGLSDSSTQTLILTPGESYEVDFAFVPASGGDSSGCQVTSEPSPSDSPTDDGSDSGSGSTGSVSGSDSDSTSGTTDGGGTTTASNASYTTVVGASDPASILLTHTAEAGSPSYSVNLSGACAGTVYRTGLLPVQ